jgi:hypothetical protein
MAISAARSLGLQRQKVHGQHPGRAVLFAKNPEQPHIIGASGELAFAARYHLPVDRKDRIDGDGGTDFQTPIGRVEVKVRKFKRRFPDPYHLIPTWQIPRLAPWIVFARYEEETESAVLVGWTTDTVMRLRPTLEWNAKIGSYHWISENLLCPMNHLAHGGLIDYVPDEHCCSIHGKVK